ncbi:hypothetical protein Q765_14020 [Flavobacterium rivuli WB 3.3-2 = DSM 21788]|uniref:Glycosyl hydrolase family 43 n=1 Tax=Flavobacterium rivuli WB 3.3-2 = DSM 21788 TaxID=1121895 RepID=A0A0A2M2U8_9FLAO|nr:glycosyl hydrolase [Flavobacterium rivuli]KGO85941.1 hypothetical protein Q765_14020 [Flavobacterium rivuli WB 3.3-2 = DSM 21788]
MKRRSFIKATASAGLLTLITPRSVLHALPLHIDSSLESHFFNPPSSARSQTWWHWMNGNITKAGITLDLEAMKAVGLGGFQLFNAGTGITKGPVEYLSQEWLDLTQHAISEAQRLELEFAMHNCPGWSSSGGPWITPEMSMQQLTWTEKIINGDKKIKIKLVEPTNNLGYYRDAKIIAFPSLKNEETDFADILKSTHSASGKIALDNGPFILEPGTGEAMGSIVLELKKTIPVTNVTLFTGILNGNGNFTAELSNDGINFTNTSNFTGGSSNHEIEGNMPATANFVASKARYIRLNSSAKRVITSITLTGADRNPDWLYKGNYRNAGWKRTSTLVRPNVDSINPDTVIDITAFADAEGNLLWDAPKGKWTILRIGHTSIGKLNHSAPTTGTGLECDKYSKEAYNFHFNQMFEGLLPSLKKMAANGKVGLLIDSYEMGQQNWTARMPEEFKMRRRYDITAYLPALTGRIVGSTENTDKFLYDFRRTCADMMADNYHGEFAKLCKDNDFQSYTEPYGGGPFEEMQTGLRVNYNMGEFWAGHTVLWENSGMVRTLKLASSIAHATGQPVIGAEAFTAEPGSGKWQQHPYSMKALGDWMYTQGLTRFIFHRFAHQPHPTAAPGMTMGPWGIHFDRTNTWWNMAKAWLDYTARSQFLLQQGNFVADLAYLTSEAPGYSIPTLPGQLSYYPPYGYGYDLVAAETLEKSVVENGILSTPGGMKYRVLILPKEKSMSVRTLSIISSFVQKGLTVVGNRPIQIPGLAVDKSEHELFESTVADLWSATEHSKIKDPVSNSTDKGKILKNVLREIGLTEDFSFSSESGDAPINYIHRFDGKNEIYFIANRRRTTEKLVCNFRVQNMQPELWDPDTGKHYTLPSFTVQGKNIVMPLTLPPSGSAFIIFRKAYSGSPVSAVSLLGKEIWAAKQFPMIAVGKFGDVSNNFCVGVWLKPETDIPLDKEQYFGAKKTDHYAIYPPSGKTIYGPGHAASGLTVGRNGIVLYEREDEELIDVLSAKIAIAGWAHIGINYQDGSPSLYVNGKLVMKAPASGRIVHPGFGEAFQDDGASYYNGDMATPQLLDFPFSLSDEKILKSKKDSTAIVPMQCNFYPKNNTLQFNSDGNYSIENIKGYKNLLKVTGTGNTLDLTNHWVVSFPPGLGAPDSIRLEKLESLHHNGLDGIKYFSGTATYTRQFTNTFEGGRASNRIILDLGKVEVIARVTLNNKDLGVLWKPPYSLDITDYLLEGKNKLSISVTNLWPNRLIGDEQLPPENEYELSAWPGKFKVLGDGAITALPKWYVEGKPKPKGGRVAFTTWKHYDHDSPLLESGLIGPVTLRSVFLHTITL